MDDVIAWSNTRVCVFEVHYQIRPFLAKFLGMTIFSSFDNLPISLILVSFFQ